MRVSVSNKRKSDQGVGNFLRQLCDELPNHGIEVVGETDKCDLHLAAIHSLRPHCKNVLRIDGVYYDQERFSWNGRIRRAMAQAEGVVFQSQWSQILAVNMLRVHPRISTVIWNGVNQTKLAEIPKASSKTPFTFSACAAWRESKRPEAVINSFLKAREVSKQNIQLKMIGPIKPRVKHAAIQYLGKIEHDKALSAIKSSDCLIHICHLDACPNAVVEALSMGVPVVCNNIGGTPELVKKDGLVLPLDRPFKFKVISSMSTVGSKAIDINVLSTGLLKAMRTSWNIARPELDISRSAASYAKFFRRVVGE